MQGKSNSLTARATAGLRSTPQPSSPPASGRKRPWRLRALLGIVVAGILWSVPAGAIEPVAGDRPISFQADELTWDRANRVLRATGNVDAVQGDRRVVADSVVYDEAANRVTAEGNVVLYEPSGEVIHGDRVELTGDLREGVINDLRAVLADGARLTASKGERSQGYLTEFSDATYTACAPCAEDPERAPLWQVRAVKVTSNREKKIVEFSHSWLEFRGVPVAYIPYFYQPDPSVKRKSGLLIPTAGFSSDLGFLVKVPYYAVLSDQDDLTLTPWMTSKEGPVGEAEYRRALAHGEIDVKGSATVDSNDNFLGHIDSRNRYDIDENWRSGLDVQRASGRTYLRRYNFGNDRTYTSRLFGEGFYGRDYLSGNALAFQNFEEDVDQDTIPYVAPLLDYYHSGDRNLFGGSTDLHINTAVLTRQNGEDTRRLSARGEWSHPWVGPLGSLFTVSTAMWADGYDVSEQSTQDRSSDYDGTSGRLFPQVGARWGLPLVSNGESLQQVIEPSAEVILAPNWGNPSRIPNEDSQDFELQDTNLFGFDRLPGIDVVDEGPRVNYGLSYAVNRYDGTSAQAFIGQSYRTVQDNTFGKGTGLEDNISDVVTSIDMKPAPWLDLLYRNRLDHVTLEPRRNELTARIGVPAIRTQVTYVRYDGNPNINQTDTNEPLQMREEVGYALDTRLTRTWRSRLYGITDIGAESQREIGLRLTYEDECFVFSTDLARQNYRDKSVEPTNVIFVRIGLKTIGDVGYGYKAGGG